MSDRSKQRTARRDPHTVRAAPGNIAARTAASARLPTAIDELLEDGQIAVDAAEALFFDTKGAVLRALHREHAARRARATLPHRHATKSLAARLKKRAQKSGPPRASVDLFKDGRLAFAPPFLGNHWIAPFPALRASPWTGENKSSSDTEHRQYLAATKPQH